MVLRAVGWHLLSGRDKARMDAEQWQTHAAALETASATERAEWSAKQDAVDAQLKEVQVGVCVCGGRWEHVSLC